MLDYLYDMIICVLLKRYQYFNFKYNFDRQFRYIATLLVYKHIKQCFATFLACDPFKIKVSEVYKSQVLTSKHIKMSYLNTLSRPKDMKLSNILQKNSNLINRILYLYLMNML